MDAGFLNFHKEEDFSTYFLDSYIDDSQSYDGVNSITNHFQWNWDNEQEINGDVALLPVSSQEMDLCPLSSSPPSRDDFHKMMVSDWNLINFEISDENVFIDDNDLNPTENFDITKYIDQPDDEPKLKLGGKRIDMVGRRYLTDELEENSEPPESSIQAIVKGENDAEEDDDEDEDITVDVETVSDQPVLEAGDLNSLLEQFEASENTNFELEQLKTTNKEEPINIKAEDIVTIDEIKQEYKLPKQQSPIKTPKKVCSKVKSDAATTTDDPDFVAPAKDQVKSKQILDSLPTELVDRIRQSSKRKPIPVIPPKIPIKRRLIANATNNTNNNNNISSKIQTKSIQLDHNYCGSHVSSHKDSGFSSCEEDERTIIRSQPTVKNADGKLMVSLLKTNTIKKKLNLEEYKKRLQSRSNNTSGYNSPAPEEDENARRLRHQEMLMKMAEEIVSQQQNPDQANNDIIKVETTDTQVTPPSNVVMKTLVSVGTNTEESWVHLERILQNTQIDISPNSLISSIVEHLPKVKSVITNEVEHGEDKTIVYIDKEAIKPKMQSVHIQTIHTCSRRRRTSSSSSSTSTDSSLCISSRESSRTPSPIRKRYNEQIMEVEERRVIYVGKISDSTTRDDLRRRFSKFGIITNVSVHFRRHADNYGFVTFQYKEDAFQALERGNEDLSLTQYDLSFGGRRLFCQTSYSDLDNMHDDNDYWYEEGFYRQPSNSFDSLLKQAQAKLRKRQL